MVFGLPKLALPKPLARIAIIFLNYRRWLKISAIAIPLWYLVGKNHADGDKYGVITNCWKYRLADGKCALPKLDESLYQTGRKQFRKTSTRKEQIARQEVYSII